MLILRINTQTKCEHHFSFGFAWRLIFNMMSTKAVNPTLTWSPIFRLFTMRISLKKQPTLLEKLCTMFFRSPKSIASESEDAVGIDIFWHVANSLSFVIQPQNAFAMKFSACVGHHRDTLTQNLNINGEKVSLLFAISHSFTACMKTLCRRRALHHGAGLRPLPLNVVASKAIFAKIIYLAKASNHSVIHLVNIFGHFENLRNKWLQPTINHHQQAPNENNTTPTGHMKQIEKTKQQQHRAIITKNNYRNERSQ